MFRNAMLKMSCSIKKALRKDLTKMLLGGALVILSSLVAQYVKWQNQMKLAEDKTE